MLSTSRAPQPPSAALHRQRPAQARCDRATLGRVVGQRDAVQRHQHHRRVIDVGIDIVVELEGPAAGGRVGVLHLPVAAAEDLLLQHPFARPDERGMVRGEPGVLQRDRGQAGVPDGRQAGLGPQHARRVGAGLAGERLLAREVAEARQPLLHDGMVERIAQGAQGQQRVDPGRLDAGPGAVGLLAVEQPALGRAQRPMMQRSHVVALQHAQDAVQAREEARPAQRVARPADREVAPLPGVAPQLLDAGAGRHGGRGPQAEDDRDRHDRGARPGGELVDVEREPAGQQHEPGRHGRQAVPVVLVEEGQPELREDPRPGDAAVGQHPVARAHHMRGVGILAGQLQREVGLDGRAELPRAAVPLRPIALRLLMMPQVAPDLRPDLAVGDAQVVREQQVLRRDRHVGFELAPPVAVAVLVVEQPARRAVDRGGELEVVDAGRGATAGHGGPLSARAAR